MQRSESHKDQQGPVDMRVDPCMSVTFHPARAHSSPDMNRIPQKSTEANTWRNWTCHMAEFSFLDDLSTWISFHLLHWKNTSEVASRETSWVLHIQSKCTGDRKSARHVSREQTPPFLVPLQFFEFFENALLQCSFTDFIPYTQETNKPKIKVRWKSCWRHGFNFQLPYGRGRRIKEHLHVPF